MIYLDYAATTPINKKALEVYNKYAEELFYNPSAVYRESVNVLKDVESAKQAIAKALGVEFNNNIIFTSSATESNNLAILGCVKSNFKKVVISSAEHASVYSIATALAEKNIEVVFIPLSANGEIDYVKLENILDEKTNLISVIHVNNETGAINDLKKVNELRLKKCPKAIFHADGVQALSKIKINLNYFGVDLYVISAHKIHGPKGISALYIKNKNLIKKAIYGGGQEYGLRSGTENVPAIMAFKTAIEQIEEISSVLKHVESLKQVFIKNLASSGIKVNSKDNCVPHILSLSLKGVKGETIVHMLEEKGVLISTGSACSSKTLGNRVLEAMNINKETAVGSVRISFSKHTTIQEADMASKLLNECYIQLLKRLN